VPTATTAAWTKEEHKPFKSAVATAAAPPRDGPTDEGWFAVLTQACRCG
jgi:hypothetical protein